MVCREPTRPPAIPEIAPFPPLQLRFRALHLGGRCEWLDRGADREEGALLHTFYPLNTPITLRRIHSELDWKPNWISRRLSTSNLRSLDPGDHPLGSSSIQDPTLFHDVCVTGPRQFLDRISAPFRRPSRGQAW
ncbi:uncharacterized protein QC763_0105580 [Podospora pseudopauciseta]|uniref:Uncharacterized protein n=1 Tax=Podospora pseudopauciseta TaxID=2093780 RepID=A0ABR0H1E9_9PEZI|nr:hypothetical protein QC763_0105580 [Podospora pseudopauciseta]